MYFQKVWGNWFGIQLQSHLFRNRWIDSRNRKWFGRRTPFILEEDGLLSSTSNPYSQLISGCTSHHMKYSHNVDEIPIAWLYDHIVSCIPIIFPNLIVGCLYPHRITIIVTYAIYIFHEYPKIVESLVIGSENISWPIGSMYRIYIYMLTLGVYWCDSGYHIYHTWSIWVIFPWYSHHPPIQVAGAARLAFSGGSAELREVLQQRVTRLAEELMKHDVELQEWFMVVYGIYMDLWWPCTGDGSS